MDELLRDIAAVGQEQSWVAPSPVEGRVLLADGDSLAYVCAGNDETTPREAVDKLRARLESAMRMSGATSCLILLTDPASHKGWRYAIARVQPYQGHRSGDDSRKPRQWAHLRTLMETSESIKLAMCTADIEAAKHCEADDLFGACVTEYGADNCVVYAQDKDLQMVPGWHLGWDTHELLWVAPDAFEVRDREGKLYGEKWFWFQMLRGDPSDNIPGLPYYVENGKQKKIGPVTAEKFLAACTNRAEAASEVARLYGTTYGEQAGVAMAEQGALLWMRRDEASSWLDVFTVGNPLHHLKSHVLDLALRVEEARWQNLAA